VSIDLSSNMTEIGQQRAQELGIGPEMVSFEIADATKRDYRPQSFDVVYSRDTILHIEDKLSLFKQFYVSCVFTFV
jgi:phosphoethanolamine N-methyltransferase